MRDSAYKGQFYSMFVSINEEVKQSKERSESNIIEPRVQHTTPGFNYYNTYKPKWKRQNVISFIK